MRYFLLPRAFLYSQQKQIIRVLFELKEEGSRGEELYRLHTLLREKIGTTNADHFMRQLTTNLDTLYQRASRELKTLLTEEQNRRHRIAMKIGKESHDFESTL
ncbi:MAG: hypothetical protein V1776_01235 [Candidatus Diapherotrites archaeon]